MTQDDFLEHWRRLVYESETHTTGHDAETVRVCRVCGEADGHADECPVPRLERFFYER